MNERRRASAHAFVDSLEAPVLGDDDRHHLVRVMRLSVGEMVTVSDGAGGWRICEHLGDGGLQPASDVYREPPRAPRLAVGFVVMKGDRPEWVVQKLTELGIDRIVPLHSARSVVRWDGARSAKQVERLRRIAREAAMQSRQVWLPVVDDLRPLEALLAEPGSCVAEPGGDRVELSHPVIVVGPEGGFTRDELALAQRTVGLPGGILRADTAAVTAGVTLATLRELLSES